MTIYHCVLKKFVQKEIFKKVTGIFIILSVIPGICINIYIYIYIIYICHIYLLHTYIYMYVLYIYIYMIYINVYVQLIYEWISDEYRNIFQLYRYTGNDNGNNYN